MNEASSSLRAEYPGELASPTQICQLADEYRKAAHLLLQLGRKGEPLSRAPSRFSAIHAIELYLTAYLQHYGHETRRVRGMQHDLAARAEWAISNGLRLRKRTAEHLIQLSGKREYLIVRYGPEMSATVSQINRVMATLEEVAGKVTTVINTKTDKPG